MTGPSIQVNNLSVTINANTLLAPFDLTLDGGKWHAIAGPNGGGKSTFLKALCGLLNHKGSIERHWNSDNQDIGYLPQLAPFDASLPVTALDFIRMNQSKQPIWRRYRKDPQIEAMIDKVGIRKLLNKRIGTLSTGERQRVLLGCSLLTNPNLLFLDEPIAGVDKAGKTAMLEIFQQFINQGGTIVMVEHDLAVIETFCDSVTWINGGLIDHGSPSQVLNKPHEITRGLRRVS